MRESKRERDRDRLERERFVTANQDSPVIGMAAVLLYGWFRDAHDARHSQKHNSACQQKHFQAPPTWAQRSKFIITAKRTA